jgi:predicted transcriptional regulator
MPTPLVAFRFKPELREAVEAIAQASGLSNSDVVRSAVREYVSREQQQQEESQEAEAA